MIILGLNLPFFSLCCGFSLPVFETVPSQKGCKQFWEQDVCLKHDRIGHKLQMRLITKANNIKYVEKQHVKGYKTTEGLFCVFFFLTSSLAMEVKTHEKRNTFFFFLS